MVALGFKEWLYGVKRGLTPGRFMSTAVKPAKPFVPKSKKMLKGFM